MTDAHLPTPKPITEHAWPEHVTPVVTIWCIAYNQVHYIREAIAGFLIQETTFPVEILLHDDASDDGTTEIIREFSRRYPRLITGVLQTENQFSRGRKRHEQLENARALRFPVMVKPTDASGSIGVRKLVDRLALEAGVGAALLVSRGDECVVEEVVEGQQLHGDVFFRDGKVSFHYFGDQSFVEHDGSSVPLCTRWPSLESSGVVEELVRQLNVIAAFSGYSNGPMNVEARVTTSGEVFVIDLSPRNGGNNVPILEEALTGFNFRKATYDLATRGETDVEAGAHPWRAGACYCVHASHAGILRDIVMSEFLRRHLIRFDSFRQPGDPVQPLVAYRNAIGSLAIEFPNVSERDRLLDEIDAHLRVIVSADVDE